MEIKGVKEKDYSNYCRLCSLNQNGLLITEIGNICVNCYEKVK